MVNSLLEFPPGRNMGFTLGRLMPVVIHNFNKILDCGIMKRHPLCSVIVPLQENNAGEDVLLLNIYSFVMQ